MPAPRVEIVGDAVRAAPYIQWARQLWSRTRGLATRYVDDMVVQVRNVGGSGFVRFIVGGSAIVAHQKSGAAVTVVSESEMVVANSVRIPDGHDYSLSNTKDENGDYLVNQWPCSYPTRAPEGGGASASFISFDSDGSVMAHSPLPPGGRYDYGAGYHISESGDVYSWHAPLSKLPPVEGRDVYSTMMFKNGVQFDDAPEKVSFIHSDTKIECGAKIYEKIDHVWALTGHVEQQPDAETVGTFSITGEVDDLTLSSAGESEWHGFEVVADFHSGRSSSGSSSSSEGEVQIVMAGPYATGITITRPTTGFPERIGAQVHGGISCRVSWSVPSGVLHHFDETNDHNHTMIIIDGMTGCVNGDLVASTEAATSNPIHYEQNLVWLYSGQVGTCSSFCNDYGFPGHQTLYAGNQKYDIWWYAGYGCGEFSIPGVSVSGSDAWGNSVSLPETRSVSTIPGSSCNPGCFAPYSIANPLEGWGACGVCGYCVPCSNPTAYRYALCYTIYNGVCP